MNKLKFPDDISDVPNNNKFLNIEGKDIQFRNYTPMDTELRKMQKGVE